MGTCVEGGRPICTSSRRVPVCHYVTHRGPVSTLPRLTQRMLEAGKENEEACTEECRRSPSATSHPGCHGHCGWSHFLRAVLHASPRLGVTPLDPPLPHYYCAQPPHSFFTTLVNTYCYTPSTSCLRCSTLDLITSRARHHYHHQIAILCSLLSAIIFLNSCVRSSTGPVWVPCVHMKPGYSCCSSFVVKTVFSLFLVYYAIRALFVVITLRICFARYFGLCPAEYRCTHVGI